MSLLKRKFKINVFTISVPAKNWTYNLYLFILHYRYLLGQPNIYQYATINLDLGKR